VPALPTGGRLLTLSDHAETVEAQFLGPAPAVDPQMQGLGFLFLVAPNSTHLLPGAAVTGFLSLPGDQQSGVLVPRDAFVRFNGGTWTYRQSGDQTFERVEVPLEHPLADGWFVSEGFKAGDKLVVVGAQELLSEELKGAGGGD
jgi:multidrug efflux pump subunit AcrA (membrane-fusion protein)